jgi:hypothetical protein
LQHAVMVHLRLRAGAFGDDEEREAIFALEEQLTQAIQDASAGEFDGEMFGEGECILYMYGPDAERLFAIIEPILTLAPVTAGGFAIKQFGEATDPSAREERVSWFNQTLRG